MSIDQALQRLQVAKVQQLALSTLKTEEAYQPRIARMVPIRDKAKVENRSEEHIAHMRRALEAAQDIQLESILVAKVDGCLFVVDGHHRLKAYRRAQRETIPARVLPMDRRMAVLVSKLVNCSDRALEMHAEQMRDAAWQYLAAETHQGANELPIGESLRTVGGRFGISKNTVASMLSYLPKVDLSKYHMQAIDPGTGWPRWRNVREEGTGWQTMLDTAPEQRVQREAEKLARTVVGLRDKYPPAIRARAWEMLANEEVLAANQPEVLEFLADIAWPKDSHVLSPQGQRRPLPACPSGQS